MSLFIESLAKRIIECMKYRDEEIISLKDELAILKEQKRIGSIACGHIIDKFEMNDQDGGFYCENCWAKVCCKCLDETWIFTTYNTCNDDLPDEVRNSRCI